MKLSLLCLPFLIVLMKKSETSANQQTFSQRTLDWIELEATYKDFCVEKTGVNRKFTTNFLKNGQYADNNKFKCYIHCLYVKVGISDENGRINLDNFQKIVGIPDLSDVKRKCLNITHEDLCERSYQISKCSYNAIREILRT